MIENWILNIVLTWSSVIWVVETAFIWGIFGLLIPSFIDGYTRNSWAKLPIMIVAAVVAGVFMTWLGYLPYVLFVLWFGSTKFALANMKGHKFEEETQMVMRRSVFYVSHYTYVVMACLLGLILQSEVVTVGQPGIPVWKFLLG